eukprot:1820693-Pyramimonas_sp.AAC.2
MQGGRRWERFGRAIRLEGTVLRRNLCETTHLRHALAALVAAVVRTEVGWRRSERAVIVRTVVIGIPIMRVRDGVEGASHQIKLRPVPDMSRRPGPALTVNALAPRCVHLIHPGDLSHGCDSPQ